jgi:catechol 2,3-dioxygenase-like lactoylglutathione lyase family enzyme
MIQNIFQIAIVIKDYDEAIQFYTEKLHFTLVEDTILTETKRWVVVAPPGSLSCNLLLAKAANDTQEKAIGGRVFLFLHTDNIERDYQNLKVNNVTIIREPSKEAYGTVLVFSDLYGNLWDLIEPI